VEVVQAYLNRIHAVDTHLNSYLTVTAALALQEAKIAEAQIHTGNYLRPLHGIASRSGQAVQDGIG
jgi:aspartyl-tRNA(Asn)/glutamyl-tRNA(Gln) amidotransferase subunit A